MEEHSKVCSLFFIVLCFNKSYYLYLAFNNNLKRIDVSTELVVDVQPKEVSIALLDDKRLVELQKEARNISFSVGDIYLGRVKKLMPGLNAAFVDVGYEKDAFLHYLDLGSQFNSCEKFIKQSLSDRKRVLSISKFNMLPEIDKEGTVSETLKVGQEIFVQRPSVDCGNFFCRSFSGVAAFFR